MEYPLTVEESLEDGPARIGLLCAELRPGLSLGFVCVDLHINCGVAGRMLIDEKFDIRGWGLGHQVIRGDDPELLPEQHEVAVVSLRYRV